MSRGPLRLAWLRYAGPLGWLPDVIANLDVPDKNKPGALIVRTKEYMIQREYKLGMPRSW